MVSFIAGWDKRTATNKNLQIALYFELLKETIEELVINGY